MSRNDWGTRALTRWEDGERASSGTTSSSSLNSFSLSLSFAFSLSLPLFPSSSLSASSSESSLTLSVPNPPQPSPFPTGEVGFAPDESPVKAVEAVLTLHLNSSDLPPLLLPPTPPPAPPPIVGGGGESPTLAFELAERPRFCLEDLDSDDEEAKVDIDETEDEGGSLVEAEVEVEVVVEVEGEVGIEVGERGEVVIEEGGVVGEDRVRARMASSAGVNFGIPVGPTPTPPADCCHRRGWDGDEASDEGVTAAAEEEGGESLELKSRDESSSFANSWSSVASACSTDLVEPDDPGLVSTLLVVVLPDVAVGRGMGEREGTTDWRALEVATTEASGAGRDGGIGNAETVLLGSGVHGNTGLSFPSAALDESAGVVGGAGSMDEGSGRVWERIRSGGGRVGRRGGRLVTVEVSDGLRDRSTGGSSRVPEEAAKGCEGRWGRASKSMDESGIRLGLLYSSTPGSSSESESQM